jgi:putative ABC transport system substrate-binding protein
VNILTRRRFVRVASLAWLGLLAGCGRLPGQAHAPSRAVRLGDLSSVPLGGPESPNYEAFLQALPEYGYIEGQNLVIERRHAERQPDRLPALAAELVALPVDLIFASSGLDAARAAREATATIHIVVAAGDLVASGLVASLARPGGNVTGFTNVSPQLSGKRLELLRDTVPGLARIAMLWNPGNPASATAVRETEEAAAVLGLEVHTLPVRAVSDLEAAFEAASAHTDGLVVLSDILFLRNPSQLAELGVRYRLPTIYGSREHPQAGGLMAYGSNLADQYRRAAGHVSKILKGTAPADLPVEQPMAFDFVINLQTAQALGLTIPQHVLLQATEVIR